MHAMHRNTLPVQTCILSCIYYTIVCTCKWADYSRVENSSFSLSERSGTGIISSRMKDIKEIIHGV